MNTLIKLLICGWIALSVNTAQAGSACQIVLNTTRPCLRSMILPNTLFNDGDPLANVSPNRCRQRAYDYHVWCGFTTSDAVTSYFFNGTDYSGATSNAGDPNASSIFQLNANRHWEYVGVQVGR